MTGTARRNAYLLCKHYAIQLCVYIKYINSRCGEMRNILFLDENILAFSHRCLASIV